MREAGRDLTPPAPLPCEGRGEEERSCSTSPLRGGGWGGGFLSFPLSASGRGPAASGGGVLSDSTTSAILSAVIFNALIIIALIPLALRGVKYRPMSAAALLRRNLLIYGVGGVIIPFIGIKAIDLLVTALHLA